MLHARPAASPHVVMVVGNNVTTDTRVKKSAISLARAGLRVTVVGYTTGPRRRESQMSGVSIVRVPVRWVLRHDPARERWHRKALQIRLLRSNLDAWRSRVARSGSTVVKAATHASYPIARAGLSIASRLLRAGRAAEAARISRIEGHLLAGRAGNQAWRHSVPVVYDLELALLPEVVSQRPDIIHAHDVSVVSIASKAADLLSTPERAVPWIYDAHEYVAGISLYKSRNEVERAGWLALERSYVPRASAIVTVSPGLADLLADMYPSNRHPTVVINAPWPGRNQAGAGVREAIGLEPDVPLMVYSGGLTEARGVITAVEALPLLPDLHLVIVPVPAGSTFTTNLQARARELGVAERLHVALPVEPAKVVAHLATADIGLIPILRFPSHDVALTNKLFEYLHAGLPVVVSDCPAQAAFVHEHGVGEAHKAGDPADFARAVRRVTAELDGFRVRVKDEALLREWSWLRAEEALLGVYRALGTHGIQDPEQTIDFPSLDESHDGESVEDVD